MSEVPAGDGPRERLAQAAVARLATVCADGRPHLVPIVFAVVGDEVWTVVDTKPKSTRALRRLANIEANSRVSVLVDSYDDDWSTLWWVRVDGAATVLPVDDPRAASGLTALAAKYPQYQVDSPPGPIICIAIDRWVSWSAG